MAGPEIGFLFQFGTIREIVTTNASTLTLNKLKDLACDFIQTKVSVKDAAWYNHVINRNDFGVGRRYQLMVVLCLAQWLVINLGVN